MEALFIVPVMVSPNVNERIVPALAKVIERNIILTNAAVIRSAAIKKYSGITKISASEGLEDEIGKVLMEKDGKSSGGSIATGAIGTAAEMLGKRPTSTRKPGTGETGGTMTDIEKIELPSGLTFFSTISLEPTFLQIPINIKTRILFPGSTERTIVIGVKAVPYKVDKVEDIINMMKNHKSYGLVKRFFFRQWNTIQNKVLILTKRWWAYKGKKTGEATDIIFAPSSQQLSDSKYLKGIMSSRGSSAWSTVACLSTFDFKEEDLKEMIRDYRWLTQSGWSDIMVINEAKESINFCTAKLNACYELPISYLKQVMNLKNVFDYSEIQRWSKSYHVSSIGKALSDNTMSVPDDVTGSLLKIITG